MKALERFARPRNIVLLLLLLIPFNLWLFPARSAALRGMTGLDEVIPDAMPGYTPAALGALFDKMGQAGRELYGVSEFTLDLAYPLLYFTFLSLLLLWLLQKAAPQGGALRLLAYLPVAMVICDLMENASLVYLVSAFPARPEAVAGLANAFTLAKWGCGVAIVVAVIGLAAAAVLRRLRGDT